MALASPCAARRVGGFLAMGLAERCAVVKPSQRWRLALSLISLVLVDQRPTLRSLHKGLAIGKQKGKVTSENGGSETACFGWTVLLANSITKFVNLHVVPRVSADFTHVYCLSPCVHISALESGQEAQDKLLQESLNWKGRASSQEPRKRKLTDNMTIKNDVRMQHSIDTKPCS